MRVAIVSHAYVIDANRGKLEHLAASPGLEVCTISLGQWTNRDLGQTFRVDPDSSGRLLALKAWSLGAPALFLYDPRQLRRVLRVFQPDLLYVEEEPWTLAALQCSVAAKRLGCGLVFFTWQNVDRTLPLPLRAIRRVVLRCAKAAVAGNREARVLLREDGFDRPVAVLPQLGVNTERLSPRRPPDRRGGFVVGYVGRLVPQKGVELLLTALARLRQDSQLLVIGRGPLEAELATAAVGQGLGDRVKFFHDVAHRDIGLYLRRMDALVLPSLTTPVWKEQFGHVLVEAMACGVPVVGSDSGAIPEVIADAGLTFKEGDVHELTSALQRIAEDGELRDALAKRGRARVLTEYSDAIVAQRLASFWAEIAVDRPPRA